MLLLGTSKVGKNGSSCSHTIQNWKFSSSVTTYYSLGFPAKFILKVSETLSTSQTSTANAFFTPVYCWGKQTPFDLVLISLINFLFKPHSEEFKWNTWDSRHLCRPCKWAWVSPFLRTAAQNHENNPLVTTRFRPNYHRLHRRQLTYTGRSDLNQNQPQLRITVCLGSSHLKIFT